MQVEFAELAHAALKRHFADEDRRKSAYASLRWYLVVRGDDFSRPCPAFPDIDFRLFPFGQLQVLWEKQRDKIVIWSIRTPTRSQPAL